MKRVSVKLPCNEYDIIIEHGILKEENRIGREIKDIFQGKRVYIITDSNVSPLYLQRVRDNIETSGYTVFHHIIKAGEESKNFVQLQRIYNFLIENGASRKDLLVALGGGVIGDMAGFAAATYMRGIKFLQIPTTLLAQIDSSIGGKVAVNLMEGKNLIGAFYHPQKVLIDPECLYSLSERVFADGAAEALKYGYISDYRIYEIFKSLKTLKELYEHLDEIIYQCCAIKRDIVEEDEKELGVRMLLNFGHTIGHSYESHYQYKKYTHGEAVAIGMYEICKICEQKGFTEKGVSEDLKNILLVLNLPFEDDEKSRAVKEKIVEGIYKDKKSNSEYTSLVLIKEIGKLFVERVLLEEIKPFFEEGGFLT